MRNGISIVALLILVAIGGYYIRDLLSNPEVFPPDDYIQYWAAGKLNLNGENPYDGEKLLPLQRANGGIYDYPIMMWNPPWTLSLAMPIACLPARVGQFLWVGIGFFLLVFSVDLLWRFYGGDPSRRWLAWIVAVGFVPTLILAKAGQIGFCFLLGATLFLHFERARKPLFAGAACCLLAVKPHLMYLFWPALAVWVLRKPGWNRSGILVGGIALGIVASIIPMLSNAEVFQHYRDAMTNRPPDRWRSPTVGTFLRMFIGEERFWLQFLAPLGGLAWLAYDAWRHREHTWVWGDRLPLVLFVSYITASYGAWPYDLVLLYPALVQVAIRLDRERVRWKIAFALGVYIFIDAIGLYINLNEIGSEWFIWVAPTMLIVYLVVAKPLVAEKS
jgi:hypothetical protein